MPRRVSDLKKQTNQPIPAPIGSVRWRIQQRWRRLDLLKKCLLLSLLLHLLIVFLLGLIVVSEQVIVYVSEKQMSVQLDPYSPRQRDARSRLRSPLSNVSAGDPTRSESYQSQRRSAQRASGRATHVRMAKPRTDPSVRSRVEAAARQQRADAATDLVQPREVQMHVDMPQSERLAASEAAMSAQPDSMQRRVEHRQRRPRTVKLADAFTDALATSMASLQEALQQTDRQTEHTPTPRDQPVKTARLADQSRPLRVTEQAEPAAELQQSMARRQQSSTRRVAVNVRSAVEAQREPAKIPPLKSERLTERTPALPAAADASARSSSQAAVSVRLPSMADARLSTTEPTPQSAAYARVAHRQRADRPTRSRTETKLELAVRSAAAPTAPASSAAARAPTTTGRATVAHETARPSSRMSASASPNTRFTQIKSGGPVAMAEQQPTGASPQRTAATRTAAGSATQARTIQVAAQPAGTTGRSQARATSTTARDASRAAAGSASSERTMSHTGSTMRIITTANSHGRVASAETGPGTAQQGPRHATRQRADAGHSGPPGQGKATGRSVEVGVAPASATSARSMSPGQLGAPTRTPPAPSSGLAAGSAADRAGRAVGGTIAAAPTATGGVVAAAETGIQDAATGLAPSASRLAANGTRATRGASGLTLAAQPATAFAGATLTGATPLGFEPRRPTNVIGYGRSPQRARGFAGRSPVRLASVPHSSTSSISSHERDVNAVAAARPLTTNRRAAHLGATEKRTSPIALQPDTSRTETTTMSITSAPVMMAASATVSAPRRTPIALQRATVNVTLPKSESQHVVKTESLVTSDALTISPFQPATRRLASLDRKRMPATHTSHKTEPMLVSLASSAAPSVNASTPTEPLITAKPITAAPPPIPTADLTGRLFDRSTSMRQRLVRAMGGTSESESAVDKALAYLASVQEPDGRWSHFKNERPDKAQLRYKHDMALTGLASLCFLAANHTPNAPGPYQQCIAGAIDFLAEGQSADGSLHGQGNMYDHAIANLALAEVAIMTDDPRYTDPALAGARYILDAQHPRTGGWRYKPGQTGDTSVFGWQVLVLHSCSQLGLEMPQATKDGAERWLKHVSSGSHGVLAGYMNKLPRPAMTAEASLARMLLGRQLTKVEMDEACAYLLREHPDQGTKNYYLWYYCSLAMMQMQNQAWQAWNLRIRDYLVGGQEQNGSWRPDSRYGHAGGRIYSTALATLTLEVYYRYLPMYRTETITDTSN